MLENPKLLREMVARSGAHGTNEESEESVEHLCSKCDDYSKEWASVADDIWAGQKHISKAYENYAKKDGKAENIVTFRHFPKHHHVEHKRA